MPKIALIDDDPDIIEANTLLLEAKGFQIVTANSADEGLALVQKENPDLILLDVMMQEPDDGFYVANKLRKIGVKTPIIMLTSVSKAVGYTFGASDILPVEEFLEKPISPHVLLEKVKKYLQ